MRASVSAQFTFCQTSAYKQSFILKDSEKASHLKRKGTLKSKSHKVVPKPPRLFFIVRNHPKKQKYVPT
jgi:hypothetical protein